MYPHTGRYKSAWESLAKIFTFISDLFPFVSDNIVQMYPLLYSLYNN